MQRPFNARLLKNSLKVRRQYHQLSDPCRQPPLPRSNPTMAGTPQRRSPRRSPTPTAFKPFAPLGNATLTGWSRSACISQKVEEINNGMVFHAAPMFQYLSQTRRIGNEVQRAERKGGKSTRLSTSWPQNPRRHFSIKCFMAVETIGTASRSTLFISSHASRLCMASNSPWTFLRSRRLADRSQDQARPFQFFRLRSKQSSRSSLRR